MDLMALLVHQEKTELPAKTVYNTNPNIICSTHRMISLRITV